MSLFICYMLKSTNLLAGYVISGPQRWNTYGIPLHANFGQDVGITLKGWTNHLRNHKMRNMGIIGVGGACLSVAAIGGGIGLAMGGEAIGLGALEQFVAGGLASTVTAGAVPTHNKTVGGCTQMAEKKFANMRGVVIERRQRSFNFLDRDSRFKPRVVKVRWTALNEQGNQFTFTSWHDPSDIYPIQEMKPVAC